QHDVAGAPCSRDEADVRHEADATDDGRGWDRPAVGLVVERDVARDDRDPEGSCGMGDTLDRPSELPADLGLLGIAEVEAIGEGERLAASAGDVARGAEDCKHAGAVRIALP